MMQQAKQPVAAIFSFDAIGDLSPLAGNRSVREQPSKRLMMKRDSRSSWRRICFIGLMVLTSSSCTDATRRHLHHIETRRDNSIVHESWNHDENWRRAEEKDDNKDENKQNNNKNENNQNNNKDENNQNKDTNDNSNNDVNDEQTNANQNSFDGTVSKIEQNFLDMFYKPPSEWTTEHWGAFAGMVTLVLVSILWWCIACVVPTCCPKPRPLQPQLLLDNKDSCESTLSDSPYTSEESHSSNEESYHEYDDWSRCYIKYTQGMPPTYAG